MFNLIISVLLRDSHVNICRRFPGQENNASDSKIPSILYYNKNGQVMAVGAEALLPHIMDQAEDENWTKVGWWVY